MKRETGALLEKAARAIFGGKILLRRGDTDLATGLAHLSMCYTARALLIEHGLRADGRGAVRRAFGERFVKTGEFDPSFYQQLLDAHDQWIAADDNRVETRLSVGDVRKTIAQAQAFLLETRRYLALHHRGGQENTGIRRRTSPPQ